MKFPVLMSPIKVGSMELKNRFVIPPMGTKFGNSDSTVSQQLIDYWKLRAQGGYGLLILEVAAIDPLGKAIPGQLGLWDDKFIPGLKQLVDEVHKHGDVKMAVQLHHAGRQTMSAVIGAQPVAPSPIPCPVDKEMPRELATEEVYDLIEKFGDAAKRAKEIGFDAVEVHGAHGYLVAQFMSAYSNKRSDEFGGDFNSRMKFPVEIVKNIRRKVGNGLPILFRISGDEDMPEARTITESRMAARVLESVGVDAIHVSRCVYGSVPGAIAPAAVPAGFNVYAAEEIKKSVSIPVIAVGRINDPLLAEDILETGKADLVALGRESLTDPELPNKVAAGQLEEIAPCISCMQACSGYLFDPTKPYISCLVNPFTGREGELKVEKTDNPKKVMVIGGGPGGLEAAWIVAKRGHKVTLYEKEKKLGGQYRIGAIPPTKQEIIKALKYYETMGKKYGVDYKLETEATEEIVAAENPDVVILATGGVPLVPDIKGIENPKFVKAIDLLDGKKEVGQNVLVVGGGMVGSETADYLGEHLHNVTIIEMLPEIAIDEQDDVKYYLLERLKKWGVKAITNATVKEFLDDGVIYDKDGKDERITGFDSIVLAMGAKAYNPLEEKIKGKVLEIYVIGDAVKARKALEAIEEAARIAVKI